MSSTDEVVTDYQSGRWVAKRRTVIRLAPKVMAPCIQKKGDPPLCRRRPFDVMVDFLIDPVAHFGQPFLRDHARNSLRDGSWAAACGIGSARGNE
jgi:hypothetical protein